MDLFRVRLNCIDHYQATPTIYDPQLRNDVRQSQLRKEPKVPVVRVFGSTETGQKVCAHIHGAFPYLFIEYTGSLLPDDVGAYIYRLHLSIDHALAVSYRRNVYGENNKFVARITLVKGIPFYGYHVGYHFYLKIYMLNPVIMTRLSELLLQGVIMKHKFQPHESHLQYLLQFMTDYNLYGCGYIDACTVRFRAPVPKHDEDENAMHLWHSQSVSNAYITDDSELPRVSHCSIEVDICVQDILNRHEVKERQLHHDFIEKANPSPSGMKFVYSMAGLWRDETKRRKRRMKNPDPGSSPFPPEVLVSMSARPRAARLPGWIHEQEYRDQVNALVAVENQLGGGQPVTFDTFVQNDPLESTVNTVLQSVEDLYPENIGTALGLATQIPDAEEDASSSILVDEDKILDINVPDEGLFPNDSDEDAVRKPENPAVEKTATRASEQSSKSSSSELAAIADDAVGMATNGCSNGSNPSESNSGNGSSSGQSNPSSLPEGVTVSRLRSGRVPEVPINEELIRAAEEQGLVSRVPREQDDLPAVQSSLKRHHSTTSIDSQPRKRHVNFAHVADDSAVKMAVEIAPPSSQGAKPKSKSITGLDKKTKIQNLGFSVVKDPNDPSTLLRLSQQSASQQSDGISPVTSTPTDPVDLIKPSSYSKAEAGKQSSSLVTSVPQNGVVQTPLSLGCSPRPNAHFVVFNDPPPSAAEVLSSMRSSGLPDVIYQNAYYSSDKDVPQRAREYAGREFRLEGATVPYLPAFDPSGMPLAAHGLKTEPAADRSRDEAAYKKKRRECSLRSWEIAEPPPSFEEVSEWHSKRSSVPSTRNSTALKINDSESKPFLSQIDGPTPRNKHGFKYSQKKASTSVQHEAQYMSTMSLELHVNTRGRLVPNPEEDEVQMIFWCSKSDETFATSDHASSATQSGIIVLSEDGSLAQIVQKQTSLEVIEEGSELDLMIRMVEIVRTHDPDILTGFEVHGSSWGYLIERARHKYDYNLCDEFSRMRSQSFGRFGKESDRWGFNTTSTIRVTGRHMINIWRAMRGELNLLQYTMENVAWHILHQRIPHYSWRTLTDWFVGGRHRDLSKLLRYYTRRTRLDIEILETNELIPRTSEQARLLGVDFFSVFSRGSQFKVESIMFRIAKPENFILASPDRKQVGGQNALECLPLVMEPQSAFYNSPLLVLDFQSLYPSVMIAYNYCYSTFLGRVVNWRGMNKMGFTEYKRQQRLLELLKDYINIAPNGIMYCKPEIRKSLLAKMLTEILETRVMVKSGMKQDKDDKTLQQLLNNRQLALKLLANVTYGYTSASFSGRMPCSEIADSIVQTARETLERAIALIHSVKKWEAEVVYGDTDSLFIYLPGRTKDQAFDIGNDIAKTVTEMNPQPVKLKFEKVYHPCVLLAKKRYVGYKYESKDQITPEFDAKGIETVRRDGTPAEQMIEEKALKILFETADLSQVKSYFQKQCSKIMRGAVSIQDFSYAREVKLGTYSDKGPPPPGALISTKRMMEDARAEPQYGERVPYVVITGAPGARLIDRCVAPEDMLSNPHYQLDAEYYISKNLIPPLERIFNLVGANVRQWYDEMPKVHRIHRVDPSLAGAFAKKTLESYMKAAACIVCGLKTKNDGSICNRCRRNAPASLLKLQTQLNREERKTQEVTKLCQSCAGLAPLDEVPCDSKDCPVFYTRMKQATRYRTEKGVIGPAMALLLEAGQDTGDLEW